MTEQLGAGRSEATKGGRATAVATERDGWEILADALRRAQLDLIIGVAGKPVTPVQESLVASGHARWANHEAAATQYALGAAGCGARTVVIVKQVGMNAATDVLACAAPHRSGGAFVVIVGDDPGSVYSQTEGDSRRLAQAVEAPCYEPAGVADIPRTLFEALALSTSMHVPVVLRVTSQLLLECRGYEPDDLSFGLPHAAAPFDADFWKIDFVGHRRHLLEGLYALPEDEAFRRRRGNSDFRVVASGSLATEALATDYDTLIVRRVFPAPAQAIAEFISSGDGPVIVLEDGGPVVEDEVRAQAAGTTVYGRHSGHVPWAGPVDALACLEAAAQDEPLQLGPPAPSLGDPDADLSPFGTLWTDAAELGLTPIAVDAGHCWAGVFLENDPAPFCYGLGSAIGVAAGVSLSRGGPAIAVTGDMGAFHAGLPGLVQAVRDQIPVIVFVEDDGAATTTGGQPTPSAPAKSGECEVSFAAVARAIGVEHVETVTKEAMTSAFIRSKLTELGKLPGPSVVIIDEKQ